ncbi:MAG: hypothetical protein CL904_06045 [Dehalococcoidia bacterium]|nr:hypothetical protein [Dehalococcoidia bacterium]MQG15617.1 hypothetical protein [SAR202 cluster bacterium]|tara:strand:+ start:16445 stop:17641 length:1197 start_codon:yes stop_codon:yes gene_type:complete
MKFACILITNLATACEHRKNIDLYGKQLLIFHEENNVKTIIENSLDSHILLPKLTLKEASYKYPHAVFIPSDKIYYKQLLHSIADQLLLISPLIEIDFQISSNQNCIYMNLSGLEKIYKPYKTLEEHILNSIPKDIEVRIGVSNEKFTSYVAAAIANPSKTMTVKKNSKEFLNDLSVDFLPINSILKKNLYELGINTLGKIASFELSHMQAQFGVTGKAVWELANGIDKTNLKPYVKKHSVTEKLFFERPISAMSILTSGVEVIVNRAFLNPYMHNRYVRLATLNINMTNNCVWSKTIVFKESVKSTKKAMFAIKTAINNTILPGEIEEISITFSAISNESGKQYSMLKNVRSQDQLRENILQLSKRLRVKPPIYKIKEVEPWSRIPERRHALVDFEI